MKLTTRRRAGAAGLGLALVVGVSGLAAAADLEWYSGGNATVLDPDRTAIALKIYSSTGTEITTGSTTAPIGAFIAADTVPRAGDSYASVFLVRPDAGTAPGAWTSSQATGTTKLDAAHPTPLDNKAFVSTQGGYSIADFALGHSTASSAGDFANVYELRLRSSSPSAGVSNAYASTFVKVSGSTWSVTTAPTGTGTPTTPPTTPAPTVPAPAPVPVVAKVAASKPTIKISKKPTTKKAGKATVTVKPSAGRAQPTGKITITLKGTSSKKIVSALSGGKKAVSLPKLKKGTYKVTVVYAGNASYLGSTSKTVSLKVK